MNASREMPKYECHKKVWALKIAGIVGDQHGGVYFQPAEEGYDKVPMSPEYVAKHKPEVGGYYVVYEDGYKLTTDKGYADIVFRNSSNGYYGGSIELLKRELPEGMAAIDDDWHA